MGIHVEVRGTSTKKKEREYPWIGTGHEGLIVLFDSRNSGVVLKENPYFAIGDYLHDEWAEERFTVFTGTVTLSNDD